MTHDLTSGKPLKMVLQFTIPVLLGLLLQQVYSVVDTAIVGHALGVMALGGVGATSSVNYLVIGFCTGLCTGMAIPVAQAFGANDVRRLRRYIGNCVWLCVIVSAVLLALTLPACRLLLTAMGTPEEEMSYAFDYIFVIFIGIPAVILYNMGACVLRALGDSRSPVWFLAIASLINIVLDLLTVRGAAVATVVSQAVSGVLCVWYMRRRFPVLRMEKDDWCLRSREASRLLGMGVPVGLQCSITAIGSVILQTAVNSLGAICVAGVAAATKLFQLFCCPYDALAMAATNFVGQNLGAGKYDRIRQGIFACCLLGVIYCAVHFLLAQFGTPYAILLFIRPEEAEAVLPFAWKMCRMDAYFGLFLMLVNVLRLSIQGMGYSRLSLLSGVLEMVARIFISVWAVPQFGFAAACMANPLAWVLANCFLIPGVFKCLEARRRQAERVRRELPTE